MFPLRQILGVGAAATAFWLCRESYRGNVDKWEHQHEDHEAQLMYDDVKYGWGHYSGNPTMDGWAHTVYRWSLFGYGGVKASMAKIKTNINGFVNDVIMPNITPIALGIGGLYAAFGTQLHRPFRAVYNYFAAGGGGFLAPIGRGIGQAINGIAHGMLRGLEGTLGLMTRGGWGSTALLGALGYGLFRFWRVQTHQEQHDYFREFVVGGHDH